MAKKEIDPALALCAKINFDNLERDLPQIKNHPFYVLAKAQLDEALGGRSVEEAVAARQSGAQ